MRLFEFRMVMPLSMDELEVGQLYTVTTATLAETGDGSGTEYLENFPYRSTKVIINRLSLYNLMFNRIEL